MGMDSGKFHFLEPTQGKLHLLEEFGEIIERWLDRDNRKKTGFNDFSIIFEKVFGERKNNEIANFQKHLLNIGWSADDRKKVYVIEQRDLDLSVIENICYRINRIEGCTAGIYEEKACILLNEKLCDSLIFEQDLEYILKQGNCRAGSSYSFSELIQCKDQRILAEVALKYGRANSDVILPCEDYVLYYLREVVMKNSQIVICHPLVMELKTYDEQHGTELSETLYQFLIHDRDYGKTAQKLFVHRNTVQYRIQKVEELTKINFDNAHLKLQVLISFFLCEWKRT